MDAMLRIGPEILEVYGCVYVNSFFFYKLGGLKFCF